MEGEIIIVSIITTIGTMFSIWMLNQNWFKRQEYKYRYQLKRAKLTHKYKTPVKEERSGYDTLKDLLPIIRNLDGDQLSALADKFLEGESPITEGGGIADILIDVAERNPEMVQAFLQGLGGKKNEPKEPEFSGQV